MPSSSYVPGRFYPAICPGVDIVTQAALAFYKLYAVPFTLTAAITPQSLSLGVAGGSPGNGVTSGVMLPGGIRAPGVAVSIYASNASGRPAGAPLVSTGLVQLANVTWPLASSPQLPAGLLWVVIEFFGDASSQLPNILATGGGSGTAIVIGSSAPGRAETRQLGGLVLPVTNDPSAPVVTLTGVEAWTDAPIGTGCPVAWLGL